MSRSSKAKKIFLPCIRFQINFLNSCQNKLICAQRASKKITRFVPPRVHRLKIRRLGSWDTLPRGRSGIFSSSSYFLHKNVYICSKKAAHISVEFTSCGLLLLKEEFRISSFCSCFLVLANVR